jgi:hypothetical protein
LLITIKVSPFLCGRKQIKTVKNRSFQNNRRNTDEGA